MPDIKKGIVQPGCSVLTTVGMAHAGGIVTEKMFTGKRKSFDMLLKTGKIELEKADEVKKETGDGKSGDDSTGKLEKSKSNISGGGKKKQD